jgi:hypothetical protein
MLTKIHHISTTVNSHIINTYKHIILTSYILIRNNTDVKNRTTPMLTYLLCICFLYHIGIISY